MKSAKSQLDPLELALLTDAEVLPRKHSVQRKLENILQQTGQGLNESAFSLPWPSKAPKLSRGENYEQQAYRVMDFPRIQEGSAFLLYRTLILWGHPIGMHLIASGHFMERLTPLLLNHNKRLESHWNYAGQETPWVWQAKAIGLMQCNLMDSMLLKTEINKREFLKLSSFVSLDRYADLPSISNNRFAELHNQLIEPLLEEI